MHELRWQLLRAGVYLDVTMNHSLCANNRVPHTTRATSRLLAIRVAIIACPIGVLSIGAYSAAADRYWDVSAGANNGVGGTGSLSASSTTFSTTSAGDATLTTASTGDAVVFQGTPGNPITFTGSPTFASAAFNVTGYVLATGSSTNRTLTAPVTLGDNVNVTVAPLANGSFTFAGNLSGGSNSSITIGGTNAASTDSTRLNLGAVTVDSSAPITISTSGSTGIAGLINFGGTSTVNASVTNNTSVATMLGSGSSGTSLDLNGAIHGSAAIEFSNGGTSTTGGRVTLLTTSDYTGATRLNAAASGGAVRLGTTNALPTSTALTMGYSSGNGQNLDLYGFNQTVGSLASNPGGTGIITNGSASSNTISTLSVAGAAASSFGLVISDGSATKKVALTRSGTGKTTLSGDSTYTGATLISGGTLVAANSTVNSIATSATGGGTVNVTGSVSNGVYSGGTLAGTTGSVGGAVTISNGGTITAGSGADPASDSTGKLTTNSPTHTWADGGRYVWKLNNQAAGSGGTTNSWDQIIMNNLTLTGTGNGTPFRIVATKNTANALSGLLSGKSFLISDGTGFTTTNLAGGKTIADLFTLDASQLVAGTSYNASDFSLQFSSGDISIAYNDQSSAPEPSVAGLFGLTVTTVFGRRRRQRAVGVG